MGEAKETFTAGASSGKLDIAIQIVKQNPGKPAAEIHETLESWEQLGRSLDLAAKRTHLKHNVTIHDEAKQAKCGNPKEVSLQARMSYLESSASQKILPNGVSPT